MSGEFQDELEVGQPLLGARIRARRDELGLARRVVSNRSGVGYDSLFSIEAGRRLPNLSTLHRIARVLDTTARELLLGVYPWDGGTPPDD